MSRARRSRTYGLLATVAATGLIAITQGADRPVAKSEKAKPLATAPDEIVAKAPALSAVEKALDAPIKLDFTDTRLWEVASFIADKCAINVFLDMKALSDAGVTPATPVTFRISGVSLRSALNLMLAQHDLAFVTATENALLITTADAAKTKTVTRVYAVCDLIEPAGGRSEFEQPNDSRGDELIEVVTSTVVRTSWDSNGGAGSVAYLDGTLVVLQTEPVHRQIAKLLADLRAVRKEQATPGTGGSATVKDQMTEPSQRIRKALDTVVDFDLGVCTRLKEAADALQGKLGVPVQMDTKSLADAGVTPDTPITFTMKRVRASDGLRRVLAEHEMDFVIEDEALIITTADRAKSVLHPVVYPVGSSCRFSASESTGDCDPLIQAISTAIVPPSWEINGGNGTVAPAAVANAIVCNQTDEVQEQIAALLAQLRANECRCNSASEAVPKGMVVRVYQFQGTRPTPDEKGMQQLIGLVHQLIEPNSWLGGDALIEPGPAAIVVRQTPVTQSRVEHFLRAFGATPYPPPQVFQGSGLSGKTGFQSGAQTGTPIVGNSSKSGDNNSGGAF